MAAAFACLQAIEAPNPNLQPIFSRVVYEHFWFRALACVNNVHFSAQAPCPGMDAKSERGINELK